MAAKDELGQRGERIAERHLVARGMTVIDRNWRCSQGEIDLVLRDGDVTVVVEVKTRTNTEYKEPQEAVDWRKVRHIVVAADAYIKHFGIDLPVRFDIVTAVGDRPPFQIEHLENAFYPPQF